MMAALVLFSIAIPPAGSEAGLAPEEEQAIRAVSKRYVAAMRANDWSSVAGFFTADAVRMPPNQPLHRGRDAIRQWLSQIDTLTEYTITLDAIEGSGGFAYARARYTITLKLKGMDRSITDSGKAIEIWKKDGDGEWRCASAIWNSDLAPAPAL